MAPRGAQKGNGDQHTRAAARWAGGSGVPAGIVWPIYDTAKKGMEKNQRN